MKKLLFIILLITSLFSLSCNHNKVLSPSYIGKAGEITVNPYGLTPLSAVYTTESVNGVPITVTVKGLYGEPDIIHTYPAGYGTEFEIHGMFPESENVIEVNDGGRIITKNVSIGTLSYKNINIQKKYDVQINHLFDEKYTNNPELYFLSPTSKEWVNIGIVGLSKTGYIRYFLNSKSFAKVIFENKKIVFYPNIGYKVLDISGKSLLSFPKQNHHDLIKIDYNYLSLTYSDFGYEDRISLIDSSGNEIKKFNLGKLIENSLDFNKYPEDKETFKQIVFGEDVGNIYKDSSGQEKFVDWAHINSIVYDSDEDILYASLRQRGVLAIDYSEWKLVWWIADDNLKNKIGVGSDGHVPYDKHFKDLKSLEPYRVKGDVLNDGPKHQHALFLLANGNLGMFDNADYSGNPLGSRYVEYKITGEHGNWNSEKVYEYRDTSLYSSVESDVDFTGKNYQNLLLLYSRQEARILEIEKDTKNILFRLNLPFSTYRVDKMPLYYDEGRVYSEDCNLKNPN